MVIAVVAVVAAERAGICAAAVPRRHREVRAAAQATGVNASAP